MHTLSFSIDLCGSTQAKTTIRDRCEDHERIAALEEYTSILSRIEGSLYRGLKIRGINLNQLFLVKSIGDEFWYILDCKSDDELRTNSYNLIVILQELCESNSYQINCKDSETEQIFTIKFAIKCTIDLLKDYINYSNTRLNSLYKFYQSFSDSDNLIESELNLTAALLNYGPIEITDKKVKFNQIRFDPIGHDVDRFFRITKFAKPALVILGSSLYNEIKNDQNPNTLCIKTSNGNVQSFHYFTYIKQDIEPNELKGINYNYFIIYLLKNYSGIFLSQDTKKDDIYECSRDFLISKGYLKIGEKKDFIQFYSRNPDVWINQIS